MSAPPETQSILHTFAQNLTQIAQNVEIINQGNARPLTTGVVTSANGAESSSSSTPPNNSKTKRNSPGHSRYFKKVHSRGLAVHPTGLEVL